MIRIGIDAMGGDFAPEVAIEGAVMSLKLLNKESRIVLYGDETRIRELIKKHGANESDFDIVATTQVIEMGDHPAKAFIAKRDSSMTRGFNDLAEGKIDGFASAGSTGAMMVGSMQVIKPIEGVIRPVLATLIPTISPEKGIQRAVLMDVGLNVDAKPEVLAQYGLLGSIYAKSALQMENPRVALLNIGAESEKGNELAKNTYPLLQETKSINFVGNMEGREVLDGNVDVVVCDGFDGNILLKSTEGACLNMLKLVKRAFMANLVSKMGALLLKKEVMKLKGLMDYNNYGGAVLLGANKTIVKGHGSSKAEAVYQCIKQAFNMENNNLCEAIRQAIAEQN